MNIRFQHLLHTFFATAVAAFGMPATPQPNLRKASLLPPPVGVQGAAYLGTSVAMDGNYIVAGAPLDDTGGINAGVVKVFDSLTGALLFSIPNPAPANSDHFGSSVAVSGTLVVVGADGDDAGASNAGNAYVFDLTSAIPTAPVLTFNNPNPAAGDMFGNSVAISGLRVVVGALRNNPGTSDVGSAYVYDLASGMGAVPIATINNPKSAFSDSFGCSVAISGTRVAIGVHGDDTGAIDSGRAYVYDIDQGTTLPIATLNNPSPAQADRFGFTVAISGSRVVVGAYGDDSVADNGGSAYVYNLDGVMPTTPVATLTKPQAFAEDQFGYAVAISGARVLVGLRYGASGSGELGKAYVYDLDGEAPLVPVTTLNKPSPASGDEFGAAVAIFGMRAVVGARGDDTGAIDAGGAYVYDLNSETPMVPALNLIHPGPGQSDRFGASVAVSGTHVVVGSIMDDSGASDTGCVYVYDTASGNPEMPVVTLNNPSPEADDHFGGAVAISGTRIVVGARQDDTGATDAGSAYVYDLASANPTVPVATLHNPTPAMSDAFGCSVAIAGARVVVGAYSDDAAALDSGIAYVYDLDSETPTVPVETFNNPGPAASDAFGWSVAISGARVVVGAIRDDTGAIDSGSAYVYDLTSETPTIPIATLNNPAPGVSGEFGFAVGISGTRVVVGAPADGSGSGKGYVYDLVSETPLAPTVTFENPAGAGSYFGSAAAISGARVIVGAYGADFAQFDSGIAYVYDLTSVPPRTPVATLNTPGLPQGDRFGSAVGIDGLTVVVGAPYDDIVMADKGAAYVFGPDQLTETPILGQPTSDGLSNDSVSVYFVLFEAALPGSVKLTFGATTLTLAASQESSGIHSFTFDPANTMATPEIASGDAIPDGVYTVTLLYQDTFGNAAASAISTNVRIDTTPPTLNLPDIVVTAPGLGGTAVAFSPTISDAGSGVEESVFTPASGSNFPLGSTLVSASATDFAGNTATGTFTVTVILEAPLRDGLYARGGVVPGSGNDPRIQTGATWVGFGVPAVNSDGQVAFIGKWSAPRAGSLPPQSGVGIFVDDTLVASVGDVVPGAGADGLPANAKFKSLVDPVLNDDGRVAFLATIAGSGVTGANDSVAVCDQPGTGPHALRVIAREGSAAPASDGAVWKKFKGIALLGSESTTAGTGVVLEGALRVGSGSPAVKPGNDTLACMATGIAPLSLAVREGQAVPLLADGETVKSWKILFAPSGSPAQSRGLALGDRVSFSATLSTGRQALLTASGSLAEPFELTGESLGSATLPTAVWSKFGPLATSWNEAEESGQLAVLGVLHSNVDGVTEKTAKGIFATSDPVSWEPVVRLGQDAPEFEGVSFSGLKDPVLAVDADASAGGLAFPATIKGTGVTARNDATLWWQPHAGSLKLLAREGTPAVDCGGALWQSFSSLAFPGGGSGPLFTGQLYVAKAVKSSNDSALWGVDSIGDIRLLLREGVTKVGVRTVKSFNVLKATVGSPGVTRAFSGSKVVALVRYTDGAVEIVRITVP